MNDDEIIQYLDTINSFVSPERRKILTAIRSRTTEIDHECRQLNGSLNRPFRPEVYNQETFKIEEQRKSLIKDQLQKYENELNGLRNMQYQNQFLAERDGILEEMKIIRQMPRKELSDIQRQAEVMNILSNRLSQLDAAVELIRRYGSHLGFSLGFGDISLLCGNWEDAIDAVSLTTEDGIILYPDDKTANENIVPLTEALDSSSDQELAVFHSMERLSFKEIAISIDPENFVLRVSARDKKATIPFSILGLTKKNEISLNRQGEIFMEIANGNCSLEEKGVRRTITRISLSLRKAFATNAKPFHLGTPQFKLYIPKDKEEQRRALNRTTSYNDNITTKKNNSSEDFFREHDPFYDPEKPIYSQDKDS